MGCRIIEGTEAGSSKPVEVLFCSTSGWAFGPVMAEGQAEEFLTYLEEQGLTDPRRMDMQTLGVWWEKFLEARKGVAHG